MSEYAVSTDEAMARLVVLPEYDPGDGPQPCVHTFRTGTGMMIGAHWSVEQARAAFEQHGAHEAGPNMAGMGHSIVVMDDAGPVFFEARESLSPSTAGGTDG